MKTKYPGTRLPITNYQFPITGYRLKLSNSGLLFSPFVIILFILVGLVAGCTEDGNQLKTNDILQIQTRDECDLDTDDLLELLGESCLPGDILEVSPGCNDVKFTDTVNITLPGYTGCTFTVVYNHYECWAGSFMVDYTMGDFQILSHNCSAFDAALNSAFTAGGISYTTFIENFETQILNQLEDLVLAQYVPTGSFPCLQAIFFNIYFIRASCYKNCIVELNNGLSSIMKIACGADCCQRHTRACRNSFGQLYTETYYTPAYPPTCEDPPVFTGNSLLSRCMRETPCTYHCPEY